MYTIIVYLFPRHFVLHRTLCPVYLGSSCNPLSPFVRLCKTLEWIVWSLPVKQTRKERSRDFFRPSTNGVTSLGVLVHPCDEGFYSICLTDLLVSVSSKGNLSAILHKLILHSWIKVVSLFVACFPVALGRHILWMHVCRRVQTRFRQSVARWPSHEKFWKKVWVCKWCWMHWNDLFLLSIVVV